MADIKDWNSLAEPNKEWNEFVEKNLNGKQPDIGDFPDIATLRNYFTESKKAMNASNPIVEGVREEDKMVEMRDGQKIAVRIYRPEKAPTKGGPLGVFYHGGGWCIGGLDNEELLCRRLTATFGMTCLNVDYRLGPEHPFPIGHYDAEDSLKWAAKNATLIGADPDNKGFIIGGTSAGAGFSAGLAHLWRDQKIQPPLSGCLLAIPPYVWHTALPDKYKPDYNAWEQNQNAPILSRKAIDLFLDQYVPKQEDRESELFSPLVWKTGHHDLPPTVFQICGQDPLRDEGLIFERIMREQGLATKLFLYPGLPHGFHSVAPTIGPSKQFLEDQIEGVRWLLRQKQAGYVDQLEFF